MKIAVLIAGEYREFAIAHKFWTFLNWPDVDCYFSTWSENYRITSDVKAESICETITETHIRSYIDVIDLEITELQDKDTKNYFTTWKMIDRWKSVLNLLKKSNIRYDRVILIRPDIALKYDEKIFREFIYQSFSDNDLYGITKTDLNTAVNLTEQQMGDLILLGTQNSILRLLDLPTDGFFKLGDKEKIIPIIIDVHAYLAEHCSKIYSRLMNIPINDVCIVRTNCRTLIAPSFYDCKLKAKEWWEKKLKKFYSMQENIWDYKLYHDTHPESRKERKFNTNNINLWENFDLSCTFDSPRGGNAWHIPDTKENFLYNRADKTNQHHITYKENDFSYEYNSLGFRTDSGPKEFEDAGIHPVFMVAGCSITEGIGLPEHHLWHSFLNQNLAELANKPIVKFNIAKGGISIDTIVRYIYISIEHYNVRPDLIGVLLPPITRQEIVIEDSGYDVYHYMPGKQLIKGSPLLQDVVTSLNKNINYKQLYHGCYRNLLFLKCFLESKNIPWFFSSWLNEFDEGTIKQLISTENRKDYSIPKELLTNYIPAYIYSEEYINKNLIFPERNNKRFPETIARDYVHYGPNSHVDLADQIYNKLIKQAGFDQIVEKWRRND